MENRTESHGDGGAAPSFPSPRSTSFNYRTPEGGPSHHLRTGEYGFGRGDRRLSYSRNPSFRHPDPPTPVPFQKKDSSMPYLARNDSGISVFPSGCNALGNGFVKASVGGEHDGGLKFGVIGLILPVIRAIKSGNRPIKRLTILISLNVAYSTAELMIGLLTGRVGLVSDAFHLTFGCGLLTFSLFAMAVSSTKPDGVYTYGYKRLEVLSAFTNAFMKPTMSVHYVRGCAQKIQQIFLLFMSFSLAVEALHAFIQDESEHKHYLIVSAVTNLLVNLVGVWFFRSYARINIVYRKAEDMNHHSVCLHVLADSIRSAGLILASWFLTLGVENAEVLCMGIVSAAIFMVVLPLFRAAGSILLQMAPPNIPTSALSKCWRQIGALEDVSEVSEARFWELVPGHVIGSLDVQVKAAADEHPILQYVHGLCHDLGVQDLTVRTHHGSSND